MAKISARGAKQVDTIKMNGEKEGSNTVYTFCSDGRVLRKFNFILPATEYSPATKESTGYVVFAKKFTPASWENWKAKMMAKGAVQA